MLTRLTKRADFVRLNQSSKRWVTPTFVLQAAPGIEDALRIGFTVTKKQGNAVVRNRIKRRLKEAAEQVMPVGAQQGMDYVLIGRAAAEKASFDQIVKNLKWALKRIHGTENDR